ncbi:MAG: flagellar protein FlgN [Proteobacteria bacterium]|nr:flagellar protein FlgN [Pseudomonadota bacterium]
MDNTIIELLENGLYEGISLYDELLACFKKEKEVLANMDLDNLWDISKEKTNVCAKINFTEQKVFSAIRSELEIQHFAGSEQVTDFNRWSQYPALITEIIQEKDRPRFQKLYYTLQNIKSEIDMMRKVNTDTIEHSLQFLDEIISLITGQAHQEVIYNGRCRYNQSRNSMFMSREV